MIKRLAATAAIVGVLGIGGAVTAGAAAPPAKADGCVGWNGIFLHVNLCGNGSGYGYPNYGLYTGGYPDSSLGGYGGYLGDYQSGYPGGYPGDYQGGYPGDCGCGN